MFSTLLDVITSEVFRALTGRLFSKKQIDAITRNTVGRYLAVYFPPAEEGSAPEARIEQAGEHIAAAGRLIVELQQELEGRREALASLAEEIERGRQVADHYQALAKAGQELFAPLKAEMADAVRAELQEQADKGRVPRVLLWVVTLLAGAALGYYFGPIVGWVQSLF